MAAAIAVALSQQEKNSVGKYKVQLWGALLGVLIGFGTLHAMYIMPTIREETRVIVENRVERIEADKVDHDVFRIVLDRLDRMEQKIDRLGDK